MKLFQTFGTNLVLDVGANNGEYGAEMRQLGYSGRIVSFEPLSGVFVALQRRTSLDSLWTARNLALGAEKKTSEIHVAQNFVSSSILAMTPRHYQAAPSSRYTGQEAIEIDTLDNLWSDLTPENAEAWLKIDTQGYEMEVLKGAERSLDRIKTVELELSFCELYEGSPSAEEVWQFLRSKNYHIVDVQPGFVDNQSGQMLQADFTFHRD
jgi:FkbM family methyltransferase